MGDGRRMRAGMLAMTLVACAGANAAGAAAVPGDSSGAAVPGPATADVVAPAADGETLMVVGQVLGIALEGNASTGYRWTVDEDGAPVLRRADAAKVAALRAARDDAPPAGPPMPGSPSTGHWFFEAATPGQATLRMRYHRPWETTGTVRRAEWRIRVVAPGTD